MTAESTTFQRVRAWLEYPVSSAPTVSADGRWVYFVSTRDGIPQAWGVPTDGGNAVCLHTARETVGRVLAAPEGHRVVFSADHGGDEHWQLFLREGPPVGSAEPARELTHEPRSIHEPGAWRDGSRFVFSSNRRDARFFDIYEVDLAGSAPEVLLRQEDSLVSALAAHGDRLLLNRAQSNLDSDLLLVDGEREVLLNPHAGEMVVWSADLLGRDAVAAANPDREFTALLRFRAGANPEVLREPDADVEVVRSDPAGSQVAFSLNRGGASELHVLDVATNDDRVVALPGVGVVSAIGWLPDSAGLVFDFSAADSGLEVWCYRFDSRSSRPLTKSPVSMPGPGVAPTLHSFRAVDGLEIPYWEYPPTGEVERGTLISVHGGPEGQARPDYSLGIHTFFSSEGWRVIAPNVRGSTGYGRTYVHLDDVRKRMDSVRDLRDLVHALAAQGKAQPGRVGVIGGSYGGFMVLSAISTYPDLWGAAVDVVGIANFVTFLENTGPWRRKVREAEYGSLENDREFLEAISPIHHVDRIRTPLLVAHGENDPRVPVLEAEQIVGALRQRGVPVEFLRYANEGHGFARIENQVDCFGRAAEFLARQLAPK